MFLKIIYINPTSLCCIYYYFQFSVFGGIPEEFPHSGIPLNDWLSVSLNHHQLISSRSRWKLRLKSTHGKHEASERLWSTRCWMTWAFSWQWSPIKNSSFLKRKQASHISIRMGFIEQWNLFFFFFRAHFYMADKFWGLTDKFKKLGKTPCLFLFQGKGRVKTCFLLNSQYQTACQASSCPGTQLENELWLPTERVRLTL